MSKTKNPKLMINEEKENFEKSVEAVKDLFEAAKKIDKDLQN